MTTSIALYNCDKITALQAYNLALEFFELIPLKITNAAYYQLLSNGDHPGDHDVIETTIENLSIQIASGNATAFRLYQAGSQQPWAASFGYTTDEFGSFHHIDAQFPANIVDVDAVSTFFIEVAHTFYIPYGIAYSAKDPLDAFYYATGNNFVKIFPYENPIFWQQETPGIYQGQSRYTHALLRMVYSHNLLNDDHMALQIDGVTLKEWISNNTNRGTLKDLDNRLFLWIIEDKWIDELNTLLGTAGLLLSWAPVKNKVKKFIP